MICSPRSAATTVAPAPTTLPSPLFDVLRDISNARSSLLLTRQELTATSSPRELHFMWARALDRAYDADRFLNDAVRVPEVPADARASLLQAIEATNLEVEQLSRIDAPLPARLTKHDLERAEPSTIRVLQLVDRMDRATAQARAQIDASSR